ncbi:MAG: xanthine dehydrogenase family protein molybdopterin-binding subunit, partial [Meiothermus sp.]
GREKRRWRLTRRGFLVGAGVVGGLALGGNWLLGWGRQRVAEVFESGDGNFGAPPSTPELWLEVSPDNTVTLYVPKVEMGQGIHTALAQIAADELEADWKRVRVVQASTARGFGDRAMNTSGSTSVSASYGPLREAAATAREMLRAEAARQLGVAPGSVVMTESRVYARENPRDVRTYGEVVAARQGEWEVPAEPAVLKPERDFTLVGQRVRRLDLEAKLTGQAVYGYDARLPGMLYGAVARPPRYGATLKRADTAQAAAMPGVVRVVVEGNFAGVVAETRPQAHRAVQALRLEWQGGLTWGQEELERAVTVPTRGGVVFHRRGNVRAGLRQGKLVEAAYRVPLAAHAHLEPQAALVHVRPDGVEALVSTQVPQMARQGIAAATGHEDAQIVIQPTYLGGGFGRKGGQDVAFEAAMLSKAVGKPVHVGWTRTEDLRHGYFRPPSHNVLRGTVGPEGKVAALEHRIAGGDVFLGIGLFPDLVGDALGYDPGALSGAIPVYDFARFEGRAHRVKLPVPTGWWRSLGSIPNVFALESFLDELAASAGADPLEFRLRHLPDDGGESSQMRAVLQRAAGLAGWGKPGPEGTARGIACGKYGKTVVALVAEVTVKGGQIRARRVTVAVDCGLVVNPDGAEAQAQGSVVMGLSSALLEKVTLKDGMAEPQNFGQYPLLTLAQAPEIEVVFVNSRKVREPYGMGEPVIGPVAPAVANAVFALTGQRLRELPLRLA